jgi:prolyl oligopeptidase
MMGRVSGDVMRKSSLLFGLCASLMLYGAIEGRDQTAPSTRVAVVTDTYHGVSVDDPYRWLENGSDPEVRAWSAAQTARARAYLDALPYRTALAARLMALTSTTSPSYADLQGIAGRLFARFTDPSKQQTMLAVMRPDGSDRRVFLDPNALDPSGSTAIDWYVPSLDGRRVAVSLSRGGSEDGDLHVFEVETGRQIGEVIPHVQYPTAGGSAAWLEDGSGLWYTRFPGADRPEADRHFYQTVWFHRLGTDLSSDRQVPLGGLPRVAEIQLDYAPAAHKLLVSVANGDGGEFAHYVVDQSGAVRQVTRFADGVEWAGFGPDQGLYLVSERETPKRRIIKLAPGDVDLARARAVVPPGGDVIATDFWGEDPLVFVGRTMAVRYLSGGPSRLRMFDLDGRARGEAALPPVASVSEMEAVEGDLVYSVETYLTPRAFRRRTPDGRDVAMDLKVTSPVSFDDMEVLRVTARSRDGAETPINIIRRKGITLDSSHPTLLNAYGGYGVSQTPAFLGATRRLFFDAGGVYAIANIRGGGEFGEEWHAAGSLTRKQNVFDDFIAAAEWLIDQHYTSPQRLAIQGGSNGGLLMGAALTQHPELFRAVVSSVGIYDMLRVELDPNGEFNTTEFGTVKNQEHFRAMYAYSPYHRVRDDVAYPAVLMQTGENDGRVNPAQSRKMTARLQAATSSNRPILLATTTEAGHGIGTALNVRVAQTADYLSFLLDQLGMKWTPPEQLKTR